MKIAIIGTGYVGLTSGACFAEVGHSVTCVDNDPKKVQLLKSGVIPIFEPGLEEMVKRNTAAGRMIFTEDLHEAVKSASVIFIAVGTPPQEDGSVDLRFVEAVAREVAEVMEPGDYKVVVDKSTVPVGTGDRVGKTILRYAKLGAEFDVVSNPEFLREGTAVDDLMKPDRIVVGANSERARKLMWEIYEPFPGDRVEVDLNSAELIKHAANSFLAMKISFINCVAAICDKSGADVEQVAHGIGLDQRIGRAFLNAGLGYGGSCFPKDVDAFLAVSRDLGVPFELLDQVHRMNARQLDLLIEIMHEKLWVLRNKKIAVWGIAFKANTDDLRESVAIKLIKRLAEEGAQVIAYDPKGMENFRRENPELVESGKVTLATSALESVENAECMVIATEWPEFVDEDFEKVKSDLRLPIVFDGRNLLDPAKMIGLGFDYVPIGRAGKMESLRNAASA